MNRLVMVASWMIVLWMCYIFLGSLPYKFTNHPDTQHIFSTIGTWLGSFLGASVGEVFTAFGGRVVGAFELLTSLLLLSPLVLWLKTRGHAFERQRRKIHQIGGLLAAAVMAGAVFFHLASPLGVVVLHQGQSDGGSLFRAAVSILLLGPVLFVINRMAPPISERP